MLSLGLKELGKLLQMMKEGKKVAILEAMYQFAKAMPLLFVHTSQNKEGGKKRKRDGM